MLLIVGLGNPGEKYEFTRHNIGFLVVDRLVKNLTEVSKGWQKENDFKSLVFKTGDIIIVKPLTFMNASGFSISRILTFYKIPVSQLWVAHDDIDLPLGKIRIRRGGGSAGHHGVESIMRETGESDFVRFRIGVGRGMLHRHAVEKHVVSPFTTHEEGEVRKVIKHAAKAIETALHKGFDKAMNKYN